MIVILENIQSIERAEYELPEEGIVQISGDNSAGKSILVKALQDVLTISIKHQKVRNKLIRRGYEFGDVKLSRKDMHLIVRIHRDLNKCYYVFARGNEAPIQRTFREGGIEKLVSDFGFVVYSNENMILQVKETFGKLLFVNTALKTNAEAIKGVTNDRIADSFVKNYKEITYPILRKRIADVRNMKVSLEARIATITMYDIENYTNMASRITNSLRIIRGYPTTKLEKITIPPSIDLIDIEIPNIKKVPIIRTTEVIELDTSIKDLLRKLVDINNMVCPECKRGF